MFADPIIAPGQDSTTREHPAPAPPQRSTPSSTRRSTASPQVLSDVLCEVWV